ncbi:hypothetical protein CDCA_CDCA15G3972 [Cyanidium caldarium]|uniref:RING-type E3 ubiquitin transferase n=1 Tax=Cyanidium caldarium TaxID=2771 RepID=A0AAV9J031_CYACA|nr:hypothetical protein CDCA_CDCA15G3972 [Cyanidium caldarium]
MGASVSRVDTDGGVGGHHVTEYVPERSAPSAAGRRPAQQHRQPPGTSISPRSWWGGSGTLGATTSGTATDAAAADHHTGRFSLAASSALPATPAMVHTNTIRNELNVQKNSLRLHRDPADPARFILEFVLDATTTGRCIVYWCARDVTNGSVQVRRLALEPLRNASPPHSTPFQAGMSQVYRQKPERALRITDYRREDLFPKSFDGPDARYPVVIQLELDEPGATEEEFRGRVRSQVTYATLVEPPHLPPSASLSSVEQIAVQVVLQKILVDGTVYELQEIYGIEASSTTTMMATTMRPGAAGDDTDDVCIVCMTDPRDTAVLPCRHMCLCAECAQRLRFQSNRCPICRNVVDSLLHIRNLHTQRPTAA